MSTGPGDKPSDTPQRLIVRSADGSADDQISGNDTAMALATKSAGTADTSVSGEGDPAAPPSGSGGSGSGGVVQERDLIGVTLCERYLVTRKLGQGGMGAVYEATHTQLSRKFAVKVLLEKYAQREAIVRRLKQEAQLASSVNNEHIVDVTDFGTTDDGRTFVVMEFLDGESLAECLARETRLPEQRLLRIVAQAANALAAAHAKGIVHRDIKPENLFLLQRKDADFVKVVDFGISKSLRASDEQEETTRLTQTGMVLGTPLYMSPEQARGDDEVDQRVDIWALGVILYEAATGRVPFTGNNYLSVISQVLSEAPAPLRGLRPELSEEFEAITMKAMAKEAGDRYATATELLADIQTLLEDPTHSTERAKITGPRRKLPRKGSAGRYLIWAAAVSVVIAAVVVTVTQVVGSAPGPRVAAAGPAAVVVPPPVDAGVAVVTPDAPPPVPEHELVEVTFESTPPGATVFFEGIEKGVTPFSIKVVKKDKEIQGVAQLAGFNDRELSYNPLELPASGKVVFKLVKPPKGTAVQHRAITPGKKPGAGSGAPIAPDKTGGDLGGDPYQTGGAGTP